MRSPITVKTALVLSLAACADDAISGADETDTGSTSTEEESGDGDGDPGDGDGDGDPGDGDGDGDPGDGDGDGDGDLPSTPLQAGVAMRYLEYPVGISMAGYGGRVGG